MKRIKMLRNVEHTDAQFVGDVSYTVKDSIADGMIANGDAELVEIVPDETPKESVIESTDEGTGTQTKRKKK